MQPPCSFLLTQAQQCVSAAVAQHEQPASSQLPKQHSERFMPTTGVRDLPTSLGVTAEKSHVVPGSHCSPQALLGWGHRAPNINSDFEASAKTIPGVKFFFFMPNI